MVTESNIPSFNNIFLICDSKIIIEKLKSSLEILRTKQSGIHRYRNIDEAIRQVDHFISNNEVVDLIVSDVSFQSSETNLIALINKLEDYKNFWNTPVLIFTNVKDAQLLSNVGKAFIHLPYRLIFTETKN
ncbi:MAG: hypothetical protein HQK84_12855, partial [Nitrospinae bacterium]|nr:hypothetical protein [Nitrospinota bacterium]